MMGNKRTAPEKVSYVYILATKHNDVLGPPCKIGVSMTPKKRARRAQTFCPYPIEIFACFEMPRQDMALAVESAFHRVQAEHRTHGEWFAIEPVRCRDLMRINMNEFLKWLGQDSEKRKAGIEISYERGMGAAQ